MNTTIDDEDTRILNSFPRHNVLLSSPVKIGGHDGDYLVGWHYLYHNECVAYCSPYPTG